MEAGWCVSSPVARPGRALWGRLSPRRGPRLMVVLWCLNSWSTTSLSAVTTTHSRTSGRDRLKNPYAHTHLCHLTGLFLKKYFIKARSLSVPPCSEADFDPDSYKIPFVVVSLKTLASQVHCLLQSHEGTLPLLR